MTPRLPRPLLVFVSLLAALALVAAACGDDDDGETAADATPTATSEEDSSDTDTSSSNEDGGSSSSGSGGSNSSGGTPVADAAPEDLEIWQADLLAVGCYSGAVDGALGPQTEAAIQAFQAAKGLTVDGLLGPATEQALVDSVNAGEVVCTTDPGDGEGPDADDGGGALDGAGGTATLSSASYGNTFTLGTCSLAEDISNLFVEGQVDGLAFTAEVLEGTGTVSVDGGTEEDGITLNGTIESVTITDPSFTATGTFGDPNLAGEAFALSGSC